MTSDIPSIVRDLQSIFEPPVALMIPEWVCVLLDVPPKLAGIDVDPQDYTRMSRRIRWSDDYAEVE